jgi:hypothetical protein
VYKSEIYRGEERGSCNNSSKKVRTQVAEGRAISRAKPPSPKEKVVANPPES